MPHPCRRRAALAVRLREHRVPAAARGRSGPDRHSRPWPAHQPNSGDPGCRHPPVLVRRLAVVRAAPDRAHRRDLGAVLAEQGRARPQGSARPVLPGGGRARGPGPDRACALPHRRRARRPRPDGSPRPGSTTRTSPSGSTTRPTTWCLCPIRSRTGSSTTRTRWSQGGSSSCSAGWQGRPCCAVWRLGAGAKETQRRQLSWRRASAGGVARAARGRRRRSGRAAMGRSVAAFPWRHNLTQRSSGNPEAVREHRARCSMRSRTASCTCGQLRFEVQGEPLGVGVCHCLACQRRTGSVFAALACLRRTL